MRPTGLNICLDDVLVKTSGDQRVLQDPRVAALGPKASDLVTHYDYIDRLGNLPVHDDQGTKDRPYYLTCTLDQGKIDTLLSSLGHKLWTARPPLALVLAVRGFGKSGMLAADGDFWPDMRSALADAAARYGLIVNLPSRAAIAANQVGADTIDKTSAAGLRALAARSGGTMVLLGTLDWSDPDHGWLAHWTLADTKGRRHQWQAKGVNFDQAFRIAVLGAAQILSGNGKP
jgi:hypothetical protein